eukprot:m.94337 g.94337  ORF g.94337 m.94337 type:complete len:332 (-) comp15120_c1_seq1:47-1042(-)
MQASMQVVARTVGKCCSFCCSRNTHTHNTPLHCTFLALTALCLLRFSFLSKLVIVKVKPVAAPHGQGKRAQRGPLAWIITIVCIVLLHFGSCSSHNQGNQVLLPGVRGPCMGSPRLPVDQVLRALSFHRIVEPLRERVSLITGKTPHVVRRKTRPNNEHALPPQRCKRLPKLPVKRRVNGTHPRRPKGHLNDRDVGVWVHQHEGHEDTVVETPFGILLAGNVLLQEQFLHPTRQPRCPRARVLQLIRVLGKTVVVKQEIVRLLCRSHLDNFRLPVCGNHQNGLGLVYDVPLVQLAQLLGCLGILVHWRKGSPFQEKRRATPVGDEQCGQQQ